MPRLVLEIYSSIEKWITTIRNRRMLVFFFFVLHAAQEKGGEECEL